MKYTLLGRDKLVEEKSIREQVRKRFIENLKEKTIIENEIRKVVSRQWKQKRTPRMIALKLVLMF